MLLEKHLQFNACDMKSCMNEYDIIIWKYVSIEINGKKTSAVNMKAANCLTHCWDDTEALYFFFKAIYMYLIGTISGYHICKQQWQGIEMGSRSANQQWGSRWWGVQVYTSLWGSFHKPHWRGHGLHRGYPEARRNPASGCHVLSKYVSCCSNFQIKCKVSYVFCCFFFKKKKNTCTEVYIQD